MEAAVRINEDAQNENVVAQPAQNDAGDGYAKSLAILNAESFGHIKVLLWTNLAVVIGIAAVGFWSIERAISLAAG